MILNQSYMNRTVLKSLFLSPLAFMAASFASAAVVTFSSVSGSYDQGGGFEANKSIDANLGTGWAGYSATPGAGQYVPQTGVFIPASAVTASQLNFLLQNRFGDNHYVQEFRISTTTDAVPTVGGSWTPLSPALLRSNNGTSIADIGGGYARVTGAAAGGSMDAQLAAAGSFIGVTGFLLEMNPFDYNGADALAATIGRAPNGNFVFSEFSVTTDSSINWALNATTGFFNASGASIGAYGPDQAASNIVDGNPNTLGHPIGAANDGYYAQINLGLEVSIGSIDITGRLDIDCCNDRLQDYTVKFFAADGVTEVHSLFHSGITKATETLDLSAVNPTAQFVRVINSSQAAYGPQIGEVAVFGSIPEPSSIAFLALGLCGVLRRRR